MIRRDVSPNPSRGHSIDRTRVQYKSGQLLSSSFHDKLEQFFNNYLIQPLLDFLQVFSSLISVALYIGETYTTNRKALRGIDITNKFFAGFWIADYLLGLVATDNWRTYIFHLRTVVDFFTIFFVYYEVDEFLSLNFVRILVFHRLYDVFKKYSFFRQRISATGRQIFLIISSVFALILISACFIQIVERNHTTDPPSHFKFIDVLYFTLTTMTTVGYGDIAPVTALGRVIVIFMILTGIVVIPIQTSKLLDIMSSRTVYDGSYTKKGNHVIVTGNITANELSHFLYEFYHKNREQFDPANVVVLSTQTPSYEIKALLREPQYSDRLFYYVGSPIHDKDLKRVRADHAAACFIFSHSLTQTAEQEDKRTVLSLLSMKRFNPSMTTLAKIFKPEARHLVEKISGVSLSLSAYEYKYALITKSIQQPGMINLISNIIYLNSSEESSSKKIHNSSIAKLPWQKEYESGMLYSIYPVIIPSQYVGKTFLEVSEIFFELFNIVLFGIEVFTNSQQFVALNPGTKYVIQGRELIFVFAKSFNDASRVQLKVDLSLYDERQQARFLEHEHYQEAEEQKRHLWLKHSAEEQLQDQISQRGMFPSLRATTTMISTRLSPGSNHSNHSNHSSHGTMEPLDHDNHDDHHDPYSNDHHLPVMVTALRSDIQDHIIITSTSEALCQYDALLYLLTPLRKQSSYSFKNTSNRTIAVLLRSAPSKELLAQFSLLQNIYFVQGSPLQLSDLRRVNIDKADTVLILPNPPKMTSDDFSVDSELAMIYMLVKNHTNPSTKIIMEIVKENSIKFIEGKTTLEREVEDPRTMSSFASGGVFTRISFNSLICQGYFNPYISDIIKLFLFDPEQDNGHHHEDVQGGLFTIAMPLDFEGKEYGALFSSLSEHEVLPIGLYRMKEEVTDYCQYVYLCPDQKTTLRQNDVVYVICSLEALKAYHSLTGKSKVE